MAAAPSAPDAVVGSNARPAGDGLPGAPLNPSPRALAPRDPATVAIFTTGRPGRAYHEVRLFRVGESHYYVSRSDDELLQGLRRLGGRVGCDGVVVTGPTGEVDTDVDMTDARTLNGLRATCIVYGDGPGAGDEPGAVLFAPPPPPGPPPPPADGVYVVRASPAGAACASVGSGVERAGDGARGFAWLLEGRLRRRAAALGATHLVLGAPSVDERGGVRAQGGRFLRCAPADRAPSLAARPAAPPAPRPAAAAPTAAAAPELARSSGAPDGAARAAAAGRAAAP